VQQRSLSSGEILTNSLIAQARWNEQAYHLQLGDEGYSRLLNMWDLYRLALTDIADREGERSKGLMLPLSGMLRAQYLISSYQVESSSGFSSSSDYPARQNQGRFWAYRSQSYDKGTAVIKAMYDVASPEGENDPLQRVQSLVQLGDWRLWNGQYEPAIAAYTDAIVELASHSDAQVLEAQLFGQPVALPDVDGLRPLPPETEPDQGNILLEFDVSERGRVTDVDRIDDPPGSGSSRMTRTLRNIPFRPRFEDGVPVATDNIVRAYDIQ
jgi:hypothetical protein